MYDGAKEMRERSLGPAALTLGFPQTWSVMALSSVWPPLLFTLGFYCHSQVWFGALCLSQCVNTAQFQKKKKTNHGCWSTSRSPSRTAPQGVVTWQWLALWHRPSNWHCQSFTQTPTCKFLIWQHVPLYVWPIDACTGSSFTNRVDKGSKLLTE